MWKIFFLFALIFFSVQKDLFAQNRQQDIEELMRARDELLKSLLHDSSSGNLEKRMEEMMRRFGAQDDFDFGPGFMDSQVVGEYDWVETSTHRILKIKVKQIPDRPLDIKIQNNEITIKGDIESTEGTGKNKIVQKVKFERTFSIPADVDKTNPEFVNGKDGFMEIQFKKLQATKVLKPKSVQPTVKKEKETPERTPVAPTESDLSI